MARMTRITEQSAVITTMISSVFCMVGPPSYSVVGGGVAAVTATRHPYDKTS